MRGTGITNARWQMLSELFALEKRVTVSELARHMGLTHLFPQDTQPVPE